MQKETERGLNVSVGQATYVTPQIGRVLITQLASRTPECHEISKIMLKAVVGKIKSSSKSSKKDPKTFVLRDVSVSSMTTCDKLKDLIRS